MVSKKAGVLPQQKMGRIKRGGAAATRIGQKKSGADRKSTRLNSSHTVISYAVFCLKKKKKENR